MAKTLTRKQIVEMGSDKVDEHYNALVAELREKRNEARKVLREVENAKREKTRVRRNHALFLFGGDFIKTNKQQAIQHIEKMMETATERNKADLLILLEEIKRK